MKKYLGIDVFAGIGGMSLGAHMAGIEVAVAVENNKYAAETYRFNHQNTKVIERDIAEVNLSDHLKESPFILFGGPPCQGFSLSNTKTRSLDNLNNSLFEEFVRVVLELQPEWFVLENVEGFEFFEGGIVVELLNEIFNKSNYLTFYKTLVASDYRVPQNRKRFFLVGNRLGKNFEFPEAQKEKVTVRQAIGDLPRLKNGDKIDSLPYTNDASNDFLEIVRNGSKRSVQNYVSRNKDYVIERYSYIGQGQNWKAIPEALMSNYKDSSKTHSGIYRRLDFDKPSVVISNYRKNMLIHPDQNRGLSVREAARLQSIPDDFIFKGPLMYVQQQIGNAVPPLLAKAVFSQIIKMHNG